MEMDNQIYLGKTDLFVDLLSSMSINKVVLKHQTSIAAPSNNHQRPLLCIVAKR